MDYSQLSMLETALAILTNNKGKMKITELISLTLEAKGITDVDSEVATQLYLDITTSSKFVFMGDEEWDLKDNQSLKEYDKDGSDFIDASCIEDETTNEIDSLDHEEYENEELDDDEAHSSELDDEYEDDYQDVSYNHSDYSDDFEHDDNGNILERYEEVDSFDEDEYNDYMDDFEDMYDN